MSNTTIRVGEFFTLIVGAIREHTPDEIIRRRIAKELWKTGLISHHEYGGIRNNIRSNSRSDAYFRKENLEIRRYKFNDTRTAALPESITLKQFSGSGTAFVAKALVGSNSLDLNIKEVTIEKKKSLVLTYKHRGENWWFLRRRNIISHCNGKNIKLKPTETDTSVKNGIEETGYY